MVKLVGYGVTGHPFDFNKQQRKIGEDVIRCQLQPKSEARIWMDLSATKRIDTWMHNLERKISLLERLIVTYEKCPKCNRQMKPQRRKDGTGFFWSCSAWHIDKCDGIRSINAELQKLILAEWPHK